MPKYLSSSTANSLKNMSRKSKYLTKTLLNTFFIPNLVIKTFWTRQIIIFITKLNKMI